MNFTEILAETQFLLGFENDTNFSMYTKEQIARHSNRALDELSALIFSVDGRWQFDDINHTDLPIAVTDIISGQSQYTLDVDHLTVDRLEITLADGTSYKLKPIDESDYPGSIQELGEEEGEPMYFDKNGESLFLYPKPDYTLEDGMRIYFSRPMSYFQATDTTKKPGFASIFHEYIPVWNAQHYASTNKEMQQVAVNLTSKLEKIKEDIKKHYYGRKKKVRITNRIPNTL